MSNIQNYEEIRKDIHTGDLIAFTARPFSLFNWLIKLGQWWESGDNFSGTHNIIHVGVAFRTIHDEVMLAEFTFQGFLKVGFKFSRLSERVGKYEGSVIHIPLTKESRLGINYPAASEWLHRIRDGKYRYNFLGLPIAVSKVIGKLLTISSRPGFAFCSEGVQRCWIQIGAKPREQTIIVDEFLSGTVRLVKSDVQPRMFTPAECCRDCVVDLGKARILH